MASRRSSQLSYSRNGGSSIARASATMVGVSVARSIVTAAKAASRNKTVRRVGATAALAAARRVEPIARERYDTWRDRRIDRDRALKLARQIGGRYSEDTIIDGQPHFVVWSADGKPVDAFPHVDDLAARPELETFDMRAHARPVGAAAAPAGPLAALRLRAAGRQAQHGPPRVLAAADDEPLDPADPPRAR